jgi:hypothetical protein
MTRQELRATGYKIILGSVNQHTKNGPRRERRALARAMQKQGWAHRDKEAIARMNRA